MAAEHDAIERAAKAIFARGSGSAGKVPVLVDALWAAIDEWDRNEHRLDAEAALKAAAETSGD